MVSCWVSSAKKAIYSHAQELLYYHVVRRENHNPVWLFQKVDVEEKEQ